MSGHSHAFLAAVIAGVSSVLFLSAPAWSQSAESSVTVSATGGAARGASETHGAAGGSVLVTLNSRIGIEGSMLFLDRGPATWGLAAGGAVLVNLLPAGNRIVPYGLAGLGVYHAAFDLDAARFLGPIGSAATAGSTFCPGIGGPSGPGFGAPPWAGSTSCPGGSGYWAVGSLPAFYARRLGSLAVPASREWGRRSYTDPSLSVGGGLTVRLTEHWQLRPDARVLFVMRDGRTHTLGIYVVSVGYRF